MPFNASFVGREDAGLPERLKSEAAYVMFWLMEGHQKWLDNGRKLGTCPAVDAETADYFAAQSTIDMWITRQERADAGSIKVSAEFDEKLAVFLEYILNQYVKTGVEDLDRSKLSDYLTVQFGSPRAGIEHLGGMDIVLDSFIGFQKHLYQ